jgi:hypothetical protein
LAYPTLDGAPIAINAGMYGFGANIDGGILIDRGWGYQGSHSERLAWFPNSLVIGKWLDCLVGVQWTCQVTVGGVVVEDPTGWIVIATRCRDNGETAFVERYNKTGIPTFQQIPNTPYKASCHDKQGLYIGYNGSAVPAGWEVSVDSRGLTRHTTRAAAEAALA